MPCVLRTVHQARYYTDEYSPSTRDNEDGGPAAVLIIIVIALIATVSINLQRYYKARLTKRSGSKAGKMFIGGGKSQSYDCRSANFVWSRAATSSHVQGDPEMEEQRSHYDREIDMNEPPCVTPPVYDPQPN